MAGFEASFGRPFAHQLAAWRIRLANRVPTATWRDLWQAQHDRAFVVAGAMKAELLADLAAAVDKAIADGRTLDEFRRDFRSIVERHGWHGWTGEGSAKGEAWRTKVIYKTNLATSYAAGRLAQLREGGFAWFVYRHGASLEPREQHLSWDGLILEADHPFWATHAPPNGWGCSCYITGARSREGAKRVGGKLGKELEDGWQKVDPRTGAPVGIDKGWAYAPGATATQDITDLAKVIAGKISALPPELGTALGKERAAVIDRAWTHWVKETMEGISHDPGLVGVFAPDLLEALSQRGIAPSTAAVSVKPGLLKGPKADRHEAKGDALSLETWEQLPDRLRSPKAVFLDEKTGKLLYILDDGPDTAQLAVELDVTHRAKRQTAVSNMIISAYRVNLADIIWRWGGKQLTLLVGSVQ
ncbi:phage minor head protein [Tabrizicola flagellatus]|uniref:phage minor head protein n=1 Tax=Tabrizicola flagellatus TaxID=2593021 RepID=UPI0011F40681|nr:phage minor head protein [Tabrizicola flagellatus]